MTKKMEIKTTKMGMLLKRMDNKKTAELEQRQLSVNYVKKKPIHRISDNDMTIAVFTLKTG